MENEPASGNLFLTIIAYIAWLAIPVCALILAFRSVDAKKAQPAKNKRATQIKKQIQKKKKDSDEARFPFFSFIGMAVFPMLYFTVQFYHHATFSSFLRMMVGGFETKNRQMPTFANMGQWNGLTWFLFALFVTCCVVNLYNLIRYSDHKAAFLIGEVSVIALLLLLLRLILLFRQWIVGRFMLLEFAIILVEIVLCCALVIGIWAVLFGPILQYIIPTGTGGDDQQSGNPPTEADPAPSNEKGVLSPEDLPSVMTRGTTVYFQVSSTGYSVTYRSQSNPNDEITIKNVYAMTSSEADTDQGHFFLP